MILKFFILFFTAFVCSGVWQLPHKSSSSAKLFSNRDEYSSSAKLFSVCNEYNFEDKNLFYRFREDDCGSEQGPPGASVPLAGKFQLHFYFHFH